LRNPAERKRKVRGTISPEVLEQRRKEMLREVELNRLKKVLRAERKRPATSRWASAVAWELTRAEFAQSGLQTQVTAEVIRDNDATRRIVFLLLRGFMGLGLVVGICALGVIAARSVVERRQQIGMMRALGFQSGQVRLVFLIESSFIALLGIGVGVALGLAFSGTLIDNIREGFPGLEYRVPWSALLLVIVVGYAASLLTTFLPARAASKVYPAEALRYE
jgi:putative ABC transport system permease protein